MSPATRRSWVEHTADVLREFGYDAAEIERLAAQGII